MTLLLTTRYFNYGFYYYKYNSVELIFEETKLNEVSENKCPSKITCYTVLGFWKAEEIQLSSIGINFR